MNKLIKYFNEKYSKEYGKISYPRTTIQIYRVYQAIKSYGINDEKLVELLHNVVLPKPKTIEEKNLYTDCLYNVDDSQLKEEIKKLNNLNNYDDSSIKKDIQTINTRLGDVANELELSETTESLTDYDINFTQGSLSSKGVVASETQGNRNKTDFYQFKTGELNLELSNVDLKFRLYTYDSNKVFIQKTEWQTGEVLKYNVNSENYYKFSACRLDETSNLKPNYTNSSCRIFVKNIGNNGFIYKLKEEFNSSKTILGLNKDKEDLLYAVSRNVLSDNLCLAIVSDIHGSKKQIENIVTFCNNYDFIDGIVNLGDTREGAHGWTDPIKFYIDAISKSNKKVYTVIGNHDRGNGDLIADIGTREALINDVLKPCMAYSDVTITDKGYYYKDFDKYKIRMIVLNQYDAPNDTISDTQYKYRATNVYYSQDQINWFINTLNSTDSNYSVLICYHNFVSCVLDNSEWTDYLSRGKNPSSPCYVDFNIIHDIVDAWISSKSLTKNYPLTVTGTETEIQVNADFTARANGKFIAFFTGHKHRDGIGKMKDNQTMITFNTASGRTYDYDEQDTIRCVNDKTQDCFTIVGIDTTNKCIKLCRIGADTTIEMKKRSGFTIKY